MEHLSFMPFREVFYTYEWGAGTCYSLAIITRQLSPSGITPATSLSASPRLNRTVAAALPCSLL